MVLVEDLPCGFMAIYNVQQCTTVYNAIYYIPYTSINKYSDYQCKHFRIGNRNLQLKLLSTPYSATVTCMRGALSGSLERGLSPSDAVWN